MTGVLSLDTGETQARSEASELCQSCGLCCVGVVCKVAWVDPEEDKAFCNTWISQVELEKNEARSWINLPCALFDGSCTAYSERPADCRDYRCKLLRQQGENERSVEEALAIVRDSKSLLEQVTGVPVSSAKGLREAGAAWKVLWQKWSESEHDADLRRKFVSRHPEFTLMQFVRKKYFLE